MNRNAENPLAPLIDLIGIPSVSRDEGAAADYIFNHLARHAAAPRREGHNVWAEGATFEGDARPTVLLNAHIDTVKPAAGWVRPPFEPTLEGDRLYGLGANDCGGGLVALMHTFLALRQRVDTPYRLVFLASAEEEVSGAGGITLALPLLPHIDFAIVGEPTGLQPAIAEKGLMVLDCTARGRAGHAARNEGVNALYRAIDDVQRLRALRFERTSALLGDVKVSVTMMQAGTQHNVVPAEAGFTVDVRSNECYTNEELLNIIAGSIESEVRARSTRLNSSHISPAHPIVKRLTAMGCVPFGSPTLSDQALMPFASLKLGPGQSERSHTADEFVCRSEVEAAVALYTRLLT